MKLIKPKNRGTVKAVSQQHNKEYISPEMCKNNIVKTLKSMSSKYSTYDIFSDWIEVMALSLANCSRLIHDEVWKSRENKYFQIYAKYTKEEFENFSQCFAYLVQAFENFNYDDVLGSIYMQLGCGSKETGQFFTPYGVSKLMALITVPQDYDGSEVLHINEPTVGAGGMIIATAEVLYKRGYNPQRCMKVIAQDLDWKAVYMCYVQMSLLGINAVVVQGDTLAEPYTGNNYPQNRVFRTPCNMGLLPLGYKEAHT